MELIKRKLHDVEIAFKPLSVKGMMEVFALMRMDGDMAANMKAGILAISLSLKEVKGLKDYNDKEIKLEFKDDKLSDECMDLIVNSKLSQPLIQAAMALVSGASNLDNVPGVKKLGKSKK